MKLNIKSNSEKGKYILIIVLGIVFYIILAGKQWVAIEDDSIFYMNPTGNEGVMPGYPFFLAIHKWMFGIQYLNIAVITQGILALVCTILFVLYLERRFYFRNWETVICYLFCMMPYAIYLPESNITHQIMTEGVAYSLVYLYFLIIMCYIQNMSLNWGILVFVMNLLLMLLRSQLIVLFVISILILMYVQIKKSKEEKLGKRIVKTGIVFILGACCSVFLVLGAYRVRGFYMEKQDAVWGIEKNVSEEISKKNTDGIEEHNEQSLIEKQGESMSQFLSLVMIRGFFEMDAEDVDLFDTEEKKELYRRLYSALDEKEYRYAYARQDLYMWKDLLCDRIGGIAKPIIVEFINENPQSNLTLAGVVFEFSFKLIVEHMGRFIYHTWRMMVSGFISSIFFQIEKIYLLCHFITLFLYLFSVVGCIICFKARRDKKAIEFMGITLLFLITLVTVTNIIFIGLQRYMVYAMGIFYCAMYVIVKELFLMFSEKFMDVKWVANTKRFLYGE